MKEIVIIGAGYAGVLAGLQLVKKLPKHKARITIINKHMYHIFTPSLYEVATSESPQKNIAIPLVKIFPEHVKLVKGTVKKIDSQKKQILLDGKDPISYDYLIVTLGSQAAYFNIPGLEKYSIPFKSLNNAVKIQETIQKLCMEHQENGKKLEIIIGGGGFAGTELAGEILTYRKRIARENRIERDCIHITIIQGSDRLLKELDPHVSKLAHKRLKEPGVKLAFGGHIKEVTATEVLTDDGKSYPYGIMIWTGGVEANSIAKESNLPVTKRGQIRVDSHLQMENSDSIFVAGDMAGFVDPKTDRTVPNVAQVAEEQGVIAGENVARMVMQEPLKEYTYKHYGYIVPLKGRFAVAELVHGIHPDGIVGWGLQQFVFLWYLMKILPFGQALKKWNVFQLELEH